MNIKLLNIKSSIGECAKMPLVICILASLATSNFAQEGSEESKSNETANRAANNSDALFEAVKKSDLATIKKQVAAGADVNSKTSYAATPLHYACDRGNIEIVKFLVDSGAKVNAKDTFYNSKPIDWAISNKHTKVVEFLIASGSDGHDSALAHAVSQKSMELLRAVLITEKSSDRAIKSARFQAKMKELDEFSKILAEVKLKSTSNPGAANVSEAELNKLAGKYVSDRDREYEFIVEDKKLKLKVSENNRIILLPESKTKFSFSSGDVSFVLKNDKVENVRWKVGENVTTLKPIARKPVTTVKVDPVPATKIPKVFGYSKPESKIADLEISSKNWGQFRGNGARGIADGQNAPLRWNAKDNKNMLWKTNIPGLGHSCPVIWDNKLFVTTAYSETGDAKIRTGLYGDVDSVNDDSVHQFKIYCLDKKSGSIIWEKTAIEKKPSVKRHLKSTHANPTCATDGKYVVAFFASEGLYCFDMAGELVWKRDFGRLDSGWFYDSDYEWGFGSSPVIHKNKLIVQCDIQKGSFITALELDSGNDIWRIDRDEIPTWSSPTVHRAGDREIVITNGTKQARAYDLADGREIWKVSGNSEIVVPTPFVAHDLIFVTSGYRPVQPIYAIRMDAKGDLNSKDESAPQNSSEVAKSRSAFAWKTRKGGPYMPTPICYGDYLYTVGNSGILVCYEATTGERVYRQRLARSSFVGSPVASDGRIYLTNENGRTFVIKAGPEFELLAQNEAGESVLSTPAISESVFYLRGQKSVIAFSEK